MKHIGQFLAVCFVVVGFSTQSEAASGVVSVEATVTGGGVTTTLLCDASTADLKMDATGFNLRYFPQNCKDASGNSVVSAEWVIGAASPKGDGDLTFLTSKGRIFDTGLEYETVNRSGKKTKLIIGVTSANEFNFILERVYPDGSSVKEVGQFR